jgi:predicted RNA-binding protein with PIN domain
VVLLIDGYNVLKNLIANTKDFQITRKSFVDMLNRYQKKRGHTIRIVFDAGPTYGVSSAYEGSIWVVYSGQKKSADDYIKGYIDEHYKLDILVISSDREIKKYADRFNVDSIGAMEFSRYLKFALEYKERLQCKSQVVIKTTERENPIVDALMYENQLESLQKSYVENMSISRKSCAAKKSKKERALRAKLKKL